MNFSKKVTLLLATCLIVGLSIQWNLLHSISSPRLNSTHPEIISSSLMCPANTTGYNPKNTVFLVDYHYVIAQLDWQEAWDIFSKHPEKLKTSMRLLSYLTKKVVGFKHDHESILERYLNENAPETAQQANQDLINAYRLDLSTVSLLKMIKDEGYKIFFFSDMLPETFKVQKAKHPELFKLFYAINLRSEENNFSSKTQTQRFDQVKEFVQEKLGYTPEHYVFLDDKKSNITTAAKSGICSIHFSNARQAYRLLRQLSIIM